MGPAISQAKPAFLNNCPCAATSPAFYVPATQTFGAGFIFGEIIKDTAISAAYPALPEHPAFPRAMTVPTCLGSD